MRKALFLIPVLLVTACSSGGGERMKTAARVYIDNMTVDEKYAGNSDSIKVYRGRVFDKHKMSEEEYKKLFAGFSTDRGKWDSFFAEAQKYLDSLKTSKQLK